MPLSDYISTLMLKVSHQFHLTSFIEGGTYKGVTTLWASSHFENVITIELSDSLYERARQKYPDISNITFHQGDTRQVFRSLTSSQVCESIFWLDSHWSGGETAGEDDECPILDELDILLSHGCCPYLFVDDARLFLAPPPLPHRAEQWPNIKTILTRIEMKGHPFFFFVADDVIVVGPEHARGFVTAFLQNRPANTTRPEHKKNRPSFVARLLKKLKV